MYADMLGSVSQKVGSVNRGLKIGSIRGIKIIKLSLKLNKPQKGPFSPSIQSLLMEIMIDVSSLV
jgi:hypothetical protein